MTCTERRAGVATALLLAAAAAGAEEPAPIEFDPIVVVATRHPGVAWDVAASVTVLDALDDDTLAADLRDLLRYQPGLAFDGGGTRFGGAGFRIRGLGGNRVLTLVDGIPVAERFSVGSYADSGRDYAELGLVRQVEILRGPASSLYGSKALGGVVAIETLAPADLLGTPGGTHAAGLYAGDRDQSGASAASAWGDSGAGFLLAATRREGHETDAAGAATVDPQHRRRGSVLAKSSLDTGIGTLRLLLDYGEEQRDTDVRAMLGSGRFANTTSLQADDRQEAWRIGAQLEQDGPAGGRLLWRAFSTHAWMTQDSDELRPLANPPVRQQRQFEFSQRTAGLGLDARLPLDWAGRRHALGYGAELAEGQLEQGRDALQTNLQDGSQTRVLLGETFPRRDFPVTDTRELGAYLNAELRPFDGDLMLLPGLRYDAYRLDSRSDARFEQGSPNVQLTDLRFDAWTPRLGLLAPLGESLRGFVQYAEGFRAPPAYDVNLGIDIPTVNARALPNPDLRPEHSQALELGLRHRGGGARAELSVFETRYRDFIQSNAFIGIEPGTGTRLFQSQNVERARIRGIEARWRQALDGLGAEGWSTELAGAWLRGENRDTGTPLPAVDPAQLVLALDREWSASALRLRLTAADDASHASGTQFHAPGYAVLDLLGDWRPLPWLGLRAGVFNLLDRRYWDWADVYGRTGTDPTLPALARPGRYFSAGVQLRF
jgi:hemoglobin/transferrin/lactoferrin receptor protein